VRLVLLAFGVALLLAFAWVVRHALLLIYIAAVFAVVLKPAVDRVHQRGIFGWKPGRGIALMLMLAAVVLGFALLLTFAIPPIASDIKDFAGRAPKLFEQYRARWQNVAFVRDLDLNAIGERVLAAGSGMASTVGSAIANFLTVVLLIAYFILDGSRLLKSLLSTLPAEPRDRLGRTLGRAGTRMRGWLTGQLILMVILGTASLITFGLMGIPYFYLLAVFAGIANIIPLLGPLATVALAGLIAATQSLWKVLGVLIFYAVYQQVEEAYLTPRIMKSQVELSAPVIVIALLFGSELAGLAGALVAVPSAVLVVEIAQEYLVRSDTPTKRRDSES
jgi:predicted PurR-regulated permease PerM